MKGGAVLIALWCLVVVCGGVKTFTRDGVEYSHTPAGPYRADCVHTVRSGTHVIWEENEQRYYAEDPITSVRTAVPLCGSGKHLGETRLKEYNGWLAYTSYKSETDVSSFLGYFSVPNKPKYTPEVLYLFTGLQNVNWVPLVDPEPPVFDIIQPVLQYPAEEVENSWSVRSWYVTLNSGVIATDEILTTPGDQIFGNMTKTGPAKWYIAGVSKRTGRSTSFSVSRDRLTSQPWAYNTLECYGCTGGCGYEPTEPVNFSQLAILDKKHRAVNPVWKAYTSPNNICNDKAVVYNSTFVQIRFNA